MKVIAKREAMTKLASTWKSVGFVPTMGALHAGHASLISRAKRENKRVVVSIFVNPTQFGPKEDLSRYPRPFAADKKLCASLGVDAIYHPSPSEVYPDGFRTMVEVAGLSDVLCGAFRPGHFKGVATVVLKLFQTVRPARAYFGEKDFQQLQIIKRMVKDLDLGVEIVPCPTVREHDGLALSSRNVYLDAQERNAAPIIQAALRAGSKLPGPRIVPYVMRELKRIPGAKVQYVALVDPDTLLRPPHLKGRLRLLTAVKIGKTRLIDNVAVSC